MLFPLIAMLRHRGLVSVPWTTAVCILFCAVDLNESTIIVHSEDQCAIVGETIQFKCSTNKTGNDTIEWGHSDVNGSEMKFIYLLGDLDKSLKRYNVSVNAETGSYNLIINNVMSEDAGTFRCKEKDSRKEIADFKDARLIVTVPGSVECNGEESPVKENSKMLKKEDAILGITITILIINVGFILLILYFRKKLFRS